MSEMIMSEWRKARKPHGCNYCCGKIQPGERYHHYVGKCDGEIFTWDSHEKCEEIAQEIWDYCDPDEGMTEEDFHEGCSDICREFICPDCKKWDPDFGCESDESYCLDKLYELFLTKELYRDRRQGPYSYWKLRDKERQEES